MTTKPPAKPAVPIKLEDFDDEPGLSSKLMDFIDQLDPGHINQHLPCRLLAQSPVFNQFI